MDWDGRDGQAGGIYLVPNTWPKPYQRSIRHRTAHAGSARPPRTAPLTSRDPHCNSYLYDHSVAPWRLRHLDIPPAITINDASEPE
jgi:hypothetical protein